MPFSRIPAGIYSAPPHSTVSHHNRLIMAFSLRNSALKVRRNRVEFVAGADEHFVTLFFRRLKGQPGLSVPEG